MIWWNAVSSCLVAGLVTVLLVPWVKRVAESLGAVDHPSPRKLQERPIPRLGGVAVILGIAVGIGTSVVAAPFTWGSVSSTDLLYVGVAALIVFALGIWDDLRGVSVFKKFLVQMVAASIVVGLGGEIESFRLPIAGQVELGVVAPLVSLIWIVGVTNAINLLDGLDGLADGVVAIVAVSLMLFAMAQGHAGTVIVSSAVAGACLGFLRYNWAPARIYLGDSGSMTLGFLLAAFSLYSSVKAPAAVAILVPILALGLPVIDTVLVMGVRFLGHSGETFPGRFGAMFKADRKHLHHLALALAPRRSQIVLALYGLVTAFCVMALLVAFRGSLWLGIGLLAIEALAVVVIRLAGIRAGARALALRKREEALRILAGDSSDAPSGPTSATRGGASVPETVPETLAAKGSDRS